LISRPLPRRGRAAPAVEAAIVPPAETASDEVEILAVLSDAVARGLILRARGRDVSPREFVETFGLDDARGVARDWRDLDRVFGPLRPLPEAPARDPAPEAPAPLSPSPGPAPTSETLAARAVPRRPRG
jgi:hypothetical protein